MEWFYEKNSEQKGPVSEADLTALYVRGEISKGNLVWCETMTDWASYGSVFSDGAVPDLDSEIPHAKRIRLGHSNADLRAEARAALSGKWGIAVLVIFLSQLIQQIATLVPLIGVLAPLLIAGPITVGYHGCMLGIMRRELVAVSNLFDGFQRWLKNVGIFLLATVIVGFSIVVAAVPGGAIAGYVAMQNPEMYQEEPMFLIGLLLAVLCATIVGTIFWLRYALIYFIASDRPDLSASETLKRSRALMDGQKIKYCWLILSYTGWHILGFCAFGVGLLWSFAYMWVGQAAFYDDLSERDD